MAHAGSDLADTAELIVVMTDGAEHRYVASDRFQALPDGRVAIVFEYGGREYGCRSAETR